MSLHLFRQSGLAPFAAVVFVALAVAVPVAGGASPPPAGCMLTADPPFFYAGMVFAPALLECTSPQSKLRVRTQLTRDGVAVAENTRDCHRSARCFNTVGSFVTDVPGEQVWCTTASGWVGGAGDRLGRSLRDRAILTRRDESRRSCSWPPCSLPCEAVSR
jgi:hypothetical protein